MRDLTRLTTLAWALPALLLAACPATGGTADDTTGDSDGDSPGSDGGPGTPDAGGPGGPDAGPTSCTCQVSFEMPAGGASSCELRGNFEPGAWAAGVPMTLSGDKFTVSLELPHGRPVHYKFVLDGATWVADPAAEHTVGDGFGGANSAKLVDCGCGEVDFDWRDAVIYFVLLDRFLNGDPSNDGPVAGVMSPANFHGGDLAGLHQKIDEGYFEAMGINVLWISAPVDAAEGYGAGDDGRDYSAYHGYWPSDLEAVEPRIGTLDDLTAVVDAAHARGLRVIVDYVMNHVHTSSPIYQAHGDWFWPLYDGGTKCVCGEGCGWEGAQGERCWFRDYLPDFNFDVPEARAYSVGNALDWIHKTGIDGFRLDAVKHIDMQWIYDLRDRVNKEVEFAGRVFYMVGETFTGDKGLIKAYVQPDVLLDGQFDFPLRAEIARVLLMRQGSMNDLAGFLAGNDGYYGGGTVMSTFLGNHDLPRTIHLAEDTPQFGEWDAGKNRGWSNQPGLPGARAPFERMRTGFALIFALPGAPLVYYGDEIGMAGAGDPDNRRDMTWSGLSEHQVWLHDQVRRLGIIRSKHAALRRGARTPLGASNEVLAYSMSDGTETVFVVVNRSDFAQAIPGLPAGLYHDLLSETDVTAPTQVGARGAMILIRR